MENGSGSKFKTRGQKTEGYTQLLWFAPVALCN
jgi:hypothetical protein